MPPESLLIRQTRRPTSSGGGCPDKVVSRAIGGCSLAEATVSSSRGGHLMIRARLGPARRDRLREGGMKCTRKS
jgi:hypothetical protein